MACFDRPDLFGATPAPIGSAPVAVDLGPVTENSTLSWPLPTDLVAPSSPLCLSIVPSSTNGVDYLNEDAPDPTHAPTLRVDVQ